MNARLEDTIVLAGMMLITAGTFAIDWRIGFLVLGAFLILSTVDLRIRRP